MQPYVYVELKAKRTVDADSLGANYQHLLFFRWMHMNL